MNRIPNTDLDVFPLCLGGNVFGWTADERQSHAILDAYAAAGGNFVDSADVYSAWAPGNSGGESETIIGRWLKKNGQRDRMLVATKVGMLPAAQGLGARNIPAAAEASLKRLGVDRIDLYYAHRDDAATPLEETMRAFDDLVRQGKVRYVAASNYSAARLSEALAVSEKEGLTRYVALQPHYSLMHRGDYEGETARLCVDRHLACFPYFALANGFLTGKYRPGVQTDSKRAARAGKYLEEERGPRVLAALDAVAAARQAPLAAVALAWLLAQPAVVAPIASARTPEQLSELLPVAGLELSSDEVDRIGRAAA